MDYTYFSVLTPVRIGGKRFLPSVQYEVSETIKEAVDGLIAEGKARSYLKKVVFVNGRPVVPVRKVVVEKKVEAVAETTEKKGKKREF